MGVRPPGTVITGSISVSGKIFPSGKKYFKVTESSIRLHFCNVMQYSIKVERLLITDINSTYHMTEGNDHNATAGLMSAGRILRRQQLS